MRNILPSLLSDGYSVTDVSRRVVLPEKRFQVVWQLRAASVAWVHGDID